MKSSESPQRATDRRLMRQFTCLIAGLALVTAALPCIALQDNDPISDADAIYIVVGSFSSLQAAQRQADYLARRFNESVRVTVPNSGDSPYFRLVTGPYGTADAQATRARLRTQGAPDAWFLYLTPVLAETPAKKTMDKPLEVSPIASTSSDSEIIQSQPDNPVASPAVMEFQSTPEPPVSLRGYLKSYAIAQRGIDIDGVPPGLVDDRSIYQSQNSLRLIFEGEPGDEMLWQLHYELTPVFYSTDIENALFDTTLTRSENNYRVADLDQTIGTDSGTAVTYQNLDRFNLQWRMEPGDLTIGRQAIAFGSARVINPTDVFLPFNVQTLNQEYRIGIDAIRFQQPLGELGEVDMGMVVGKDAKQENSAVYVQVINNYSGVDVHGIAMRFADHNLAGLGVQTSLGEMGYWLEIAQVWNGAEYFRLSTGLDYAFGENVYAMVEYHYNGAGSRSSDDYLGLLDEFAYQQGGVFLLGQNYLIPALSWTVSPLLTVTLQSISNLDDSSSFISLSGEYSLSENLYSNFGLYYFYGDGLKFSPVPPNLQIRSEYGTNSDLLYLALRYYF